MLHKNIRFDCLERKYELKEIAKIVGVAAAATVVAGSVVAAATGTTAIAGTLSTASTGTAIL